MSLSEMRVTCMGFYEGGILPKKYSGDGENCSPPLEWQRIPRETKSIAIIAEDIDSREGSFVHWAVYNIPAFMIEVAENMPKDRKFSSGICQCLNDFNKVGYDGPRFPSGKHRFLFRVFAVDCMLTVPFNSNAPALIEAMKGHILEEGRLTAIYQK